MFRKMFGLVLLLTFPAMSFSQGGQFLKVQYPKPYQIGDKTYPVELVYTQDNGWIKLRIVFDNENWGEGDGYAKALEFLRTEVQSLWSAPRTEIGEGYFLTPVGKYPVCSTHRLDNEERHDMNLHFTNKGSVTGKEITGIGIDKLIGNYDACSPSK